VEPRIGLEARDAQSTKKAQHRALATRPRPLDTSWEIEEATELRNAPLSLVAIYLSVEFRFGRDAAERRFGDDALELFLIQQDARSRIVRGGLVTASP